MYLLFCSYILCTILLEFIWIDQENDYMENHLDTIFLENAFILDF